MQTIDADLPGGDSRCRPFKKWGEKKQVSVLLPALERKSIKAKDTGRRLVPQTNGVRDNTNTESGPLALVL